MTFLYTQFKLFEILFLTFQTSVLVFKKDFYNLINSFQKIALAI